LIEVKAMPTGGRPSHWLKIVEAGVHGAHAELKSDVSKDTNLIGVTNTGAKGVIQN
jgi:hypothetical protein